MIIYCNRLSLSLPPSLSLLRYIATTAKDGCLLFWKWDPLTLKFQLEREREREGEGERKLHLGEKIRRKEKIEKERRNNYI